MNKSDLIAKMTTRLGGDRASAVASVNGVLEEIEAGVARGERVSLSGFGTFDRRERAPRMGRNPRTGEAVRVDAAVVPVFRAATGFKTLLTRSDGGSEVGQAVAAESGVRPATGRKSQAVPSAPAGEIAVPASEGKKKKGKKAAKQAGEKDSKSARKAKSKAGKKAAKGVG